MTEQPSGSVRRVLVATDRSETAERAVSFAADMAERYGAELHLLQVIVPDPDGAAGDSARATYAQHELEQHAEALAPGRSRARVVVDEDPSAAIVDAAAENAVDVVVVGNAGMSGRKEFLLGNVPNRVSHNVGCTVVIFNSTNPAPEEPRRGLGGLFRRDA
jgi:nucleotide-binding universal stress UspA family protein